MSSVSGADREDALELVLGRIEHLFGKGAVMRLGDESFVPIEVIPTGSIALDTALGIGGFPRGRVVEIYGPESTGKTSIALHAVANAQKAGGNAAFIDAEHVLDPTYAKNLGVDTDALLVSQPDNGEQALEIADMLIRSSALDIIVIDSVAALVPRAELEGVMGESHLGLHARLMSQALRKLTGAIRSSTTTMIFINQLREKIGVQFGSPEITTGGRALKFYASIRLDVRRIDTLKDTGAPIGNRTRVKVVKNKCLAEGCRVFDPVTGVTHRIEDVVDQRMPIHVVAAAKDGTLHARPVLSWFDQGVQEVLGLRVAGGTTIWVTPDHKVLTEHGWRPASELRGGDRVASPRRFGAVGGTESVSPEDARLLGRLIGDGCVDGCVDGETLIRFADAEQVILDDVTRIGATLGCGIPWRLSTVVSHRDESDGVLNLCCRAGIYGKPAWENTIPARFFAPEVSTTDVGGLLFGLFESAGWVSREETGALRLGFTTASEQLAHQIHWLLLRFGIFSIVREHDPAQKRPSPTDGRQAQGTLPVYEVRVSGTDSIDAFAATIPMWGPGGSVLVAPFTRNVDQRRGSQATGMNASVLEWLGQRGLTASKASVMIGSRAGDPPGEMHRMLGSNRLRRDRLQALADTFEDESLDEVLDKEIRYWMIREVLPVRRARTFDIEVAELHAFVADDVVVHNCAPPFKQADFDILYGKGISREGSLIDMGVEHGLIRKSGAWYTYEGDQLGQGKENARAFLRDNPDLAEEMEKKIKEKLGIGPRPNIEAQVEV